MDFIRLSVRRSVTVTMLTVTVVLFGLISWSRLDREYMPELEFPQLVILTHYPNASSQEIENLVTKVIEESAGTAKNIHRIRSSSREGISIVTVEFRWGTDMDMASLNLREKVDLVKAKLPRDSGEPRIERFNPFALPVVTLSLSGNLSDKDLLTLARRPVGDILEKSPGVAAVSITGGREREILVELDQSRMTARGLPIMDVARAIARANVTYPAGTVKDQTFEYVVRVMGSFKDVRDLERITIAMDRERRSSGVGASEARRRRGQKSAKRSAQPIVLSSLGRVQDTVAEVKSRIPQIQDKLPEGASLKIVYDQSNFIKTGIRSLIRNVLFGGVLAFLVLFLFLGRLRDALAVSVAIPISILATFFLMESKGLTLNTISLAGLAIGVGMLVDGAIVVLENIARHRGMKKDPESAAVDGAAEVFPAVTSSVLTTIAVFLPLMFVVGVVGQIFKDLSWAVVFSQAASLIVAFTVIPLLASRLGRGKEYSFEIVTRIRDKGKVFAREYSRYLKYAIDKPHHVVGAALVACIVSLALLAVMPRSLFPAIEGNQILMRLDMPVGTSLETTNKVTSRIENFLRRMADVEHRSVTVGSLPQEGLQPLGPHQAQIILDLARSRKHHSKELVAFLRAGLKNVDLGGGRVLFFEQEGAFSFLAERDAPVMVELKGYDLEKLGSLSKKILSQMRNVRGLYNLRTNLSEPAPELQLEVKRDSLASLSLSVTELAEAVLTAVHGRVVSKFREEGKEIDIRLRLRREDREDVGSVEKLYIHSPLGLDVPIGSLARIVRGEGPSEIIRHDRQRTVTVSANLAGRSVDSVARDVGQILSGLGKESGIDVSLSGEAEQMKQSFRSLKIVLIFSIIFVFMIMAARFESLWQPLLILMTVPLSVIGMVLGLLVSGHQITAMAGMGLVLLTGIVVNNGIVLVEFVNQSRGEGLSLKEALMAGCQTRLRPILMTAFTTILGMLPLALGIGQGAELQASMAVVVVSGLLVSTLLTLLVLPALFILMEEHVFNPRGREALLQRIGLRK